ncbi:hypothetical protein F5Y14DRAFT_275683 [Nemania sp. NC0429]|nr:hypothetical protein F5Y14DRAFT_275683 [Nemania sp. NC0429]
MLTEMTSFSFLSIGLLALALLGLLFLVMEGLFFQLSDSARFHRLLNSSTRYEVPSVFASIRHFQQPGLRLCLGHEVHRTW